MNAADQVKNVACAQALASALTLVRKYFPEASANLNPWRDDPETRKWCEQETLDMAFHFPGWSRRLQCRSLLMQLQICNLDNQSSPHLLGVILRGMTFDGERWRLATVGDWKPTGQFLPEPIQTYHLQQICRDLFSLFPSESINNTDSS